MRRRDITWADVMRVLDAPEVVYRQNNRNGIVHQRGDLAVVVGDDRTVITVLLRATHRWDDTDCRNRRAS